MTDADGGQAPPRTADHVTPMRADLVAPAEMPRWQAAVIGSLALALALGFLWLIRLFARPLAILFLAIVIGEALEPVVAWLTRWMPRVLAVALVVVTFIGALVLLGLAIGPPFASEMQHLSDEAPALLNRAQRFVNRWSPISASQLASGLASQFGRIGGLAAALPLTIITSTFDIVVMIVIAAYWILTSPALYDYVVSLVPERDRDKARTVASDMGQAAGGYVRGVAIVASILVVATYIGLTVIGLDFALPLSLLMGIGEIFPIIGPILGSVPAILAALLISPQKALVVVALYVGIQQVENHILVPNIMRRQAHLPQLLAVFALAAGAGIGGILGAIVAIPLSGALYQLLRHLIEYIWRPHVEDAATNSGA